MTISAEIQRGIWGSLPTLLALVMFVIATFGVYDKIDNKLLEHSMQITEVENRLAIIRNENEAIKTTLQTIINSNNGINYTLKQIGEILSNQQIDIKEIERRRVENISIRAKMLAQLDHLSAVVADLLRENRKGTMR